MVRVMAKRRVKFTFPQDLVTQPLIYNLGRNFEIVTNIRRADIRDNMGWMLLELEGDEDELDRAIEWMGANRRARRPHHRRPYRRLNARIGAALAADLRQAALDSPAITQLPLTTTNPSEVNEL